MRINLISHDNGVGLSQDMRLLKRFLKARDYSVRCFEWEEESSRADVNIYLELFHKRHLKTASKHIGIFNMEWFAAKWERYLPQFSQLWAKSSEAHQFFTDRRLPSTLTGFISRNLCDDRVQRCGDCLHVRGRSSQKGTSAVLTAWRKHGKKLPHLTIVGHTIEDIDNIPNVTLIKGPIPDDQLSQLMNRHRFHICPSETEGWGHYISEALSCGGIVVTTNASPMNEHVSSLYGRLLPVIRTQRETFITRNYIDSDDLALEVINLVALPDEQQRVMMIQARQAYAQLQDRFCKEAEQLLRSLVLTPDPSDLPQHIRLRGKKLRFRDDG